MAKEWFACDIDGLAGFVFSALSSLVIEVVTDQDGVSMARTAAGLVPLCHPAPAHPFSALTAACPEMTSLAGLVRSFAAADRGRPRQ